MQLINDYNRKISHATRFGYVTVTAYNYNAIRKAEINCSFVRPYQNYEMALNRLIRSSVQNFN